MSKTLWARIGTSVIVSDEEYEELKVLCNGTEEQQDKARQRLFDLFMQNGYSDGESYMPGSNCCEENPNKYELELFLRTDWRNDYDS